MNNVLKKALALIIIGFTVLWSFSALIPSTISDIDTNDDLFSTQRALIHLKAISKNEHYLGSQAHTEVRNYIVTELKKMGLETSIQEAYTIGDSKNLSKPKNILAKIKGREQGKALLLLTHYDSSPHASFGASDAGSGVVTILEGVRAFLHQNKVPKNDIIILITDGEELGLSGAGLFVNQHEWAIDVALVLNFEARGSGGSSVMLLETNQGNAELMKAFVEAKPQYPVANSLAYSIYKMLPNDTDLTRFREDKNIDGFNFVFIDDHFDYHTALDTYKRLDRNTLEHQGSYLMPLLTYFSEANLSDLKSENDYIYFNMPIFKTVIYPYSWIVPMLIITCFLFVLLLIYGFKKKALHPKEIGKGFLAFLSALIISGSLGFFGWKLILAIYPQYVEILHGFTYNGYSYLAMFVCFAIGICLFIYHKVYHAENTASLIIAPLFFWLLICGSVAFKLKGASFFIIPVFFGLLSLFVLIHQKKPSIILMALLGFPLLTILSPLIKQLPVGLGLKMLVASTILIALIFSLLLPVFGFYKHKKRLSIVMTLIGICFFITAHSNSGFTKDTPKPNSLLYILNADENTAVWATYDDILDSWTKHVFGENPDTVSEASNINFKSKYSKGFAFVKKAEIKTIPRPKIEVTLDTIIGDFRHLEICMTSNRDAQRIEVLSDAANVFNRIQANGVKINSNRNDQTNITEFKRLFSYYITDKAPLDLILTVPKNQITTLEFYEASYDLITNPIFNIPERSAHMIPKPFVLNDAILIKQTLIIK